MRIPSHTRLPAAFGVAALAALTLLVPTAFAGGPPSIAFDPSAHDYGTIDSGTTASQTFTLTNAGGSATGALTVTLSGSSAFSTTADTCTAASLGPKKSCTVTVRYAPTSDGSSDTGTVTASSKKPAALASASLTGASTVLEFLFQIHCESYGGTFSTDPSTDHNNTGADAVWTCNGWAGADHDDWLDKRTHLVVDCFPATYVDTVNVPGPTDSTCY